MRNGSLESPISLASEEADALSSLGEGKADVVAALSALEDSLLIRVSGTWRAGVATPRAFENGAGEFDGRVGGVGNPDMVFRYFVSDDEVVLIPMQDTGRWYIHQRRLAFYGFIGYFDRHRVESDAFCPLRNAFDGNAFSGDMASVAEILEGVLFPKMSGYHAQARGATIHLVVLSEMGESRLK